MAAGLVALAPRLHPVCRTMTGRIGAKPRCSLDDRRPVTDGEFNRSSQHPF